MKLTDIYFQEVEKYTAKYGSDTIVLMQVGAFFEVYAKKHISLNSLVGSKINEFSQICGFNIASKSNVKSDHKDDNGNILKCDIVMAGFRDYMCDKYIKQLNNEGYTCVIFTQDKDDATKRDLSQIITPGTYFNDDNNISTNNIMVINIFHNKANMFNTNDQFYYGVANIDVLSGETMIFEHNELYYNSLTTFDELEKNYSVYNPNELIIVYDRENINEEYINKIIQYISCKSKVIRRIDTSDKENPLSIQASTFKSDKYKYQVMKTYYNSEQGDVAELLVRYNLAYESLCFLLDYIHSHNENMSSKLKEPKINQSTDKMLLANHSLKQLNIIDDNNEFTGKLSCVLSFLNNCITPMGKRKFKYDLVNPITCGETLEREYSIIDTVIENYDNWREITNNFIQYKDFEKMFRKIVLLKANPSDILSIIQNVYSLEGIFMRVEREKNFIKYSPFNFKFKEMKVCLCELRNIIDSTFDYNKMMTDNNIDNFEENFINKEYNNELSTLEQEYIETNDILLSLINHYSDIIKSREKKSKSDCYIKINETDKSGFYLKLTDTRSKTLFSHYKEIYKNDKKITEEIKYKSSYSGETKIFTFKSNDLKLERRGGKDTYLFSNVLNNLCENLVTFKATFKGKLREEFNNILSCLSSLSNHFIKITDFIVSIDTRFNKAKMSIKNNYCRPIVDNKYNGESYIECKQMRHPLIEKLNQEELYVPNDINMNPENLGTLLFGTNAVGKSSLIKSIGINVIMAQAGMFVPCSSFKFKPFDSIFTRILGNDNIFKGLSTFAVEMSELRTILKQSNKNSIVLGDELCSGTELGSAISIFVAGLIQLYKQNTKYIFATHFHEVTNMEEIENMKYLHMKHMSVFYDATKDALVYERMLKDGPGNNMYGLEVCKSLNLPVEFLDLANSIRHKRFSSVKLVSDMEGSTYNKHKLKTNCELCDKPCVDVHHLQHQKRANERNFINYFHKNNKANLMNVCKECHDNFHKDDKQYKRVKTTKGIQLMEVTN